MTLYEKAVALKDEDFKRIIGVTKETFEAMIIILQEAYAKKHKKRGRHTKLSLEEQLVMSDSSRSKHQCTTQIPKCLSQAQ